VALVRPASSEPARFEGEEKEQRRKRKNKKIKLRKNAETNFGLSQSYFE
jgi:hypothetical protein